MIHIDPSHPIPLWKQIEDGMRQLILSGVLAPDAPLPSIRELARELRVNPLTVSKAYQRLADHKLVASRRGEGTFVAPEPPRPTADEQTRRLDAAATRYVGEARTAGAELEEGLAAVRKVWKDTPGANRARPVDAASTQPDMEESP
ncbi:MAG: GntR family transcriptional regulator [Acidobacteriota bacterium]